ncbi:MAG: hypothetical protein ABI594_11170 [Ginsengibacter sp.]
MAKVTDVFVSGTVENLVFYRRMGKSCTRIKRTHILQTAPTKVRGLNFGIASRAAKALRNGLQPILPLPTDRSMQSRFSGAIARWLALHNVDDLPMGNAPDYFSNFQFMAGHTFGERCKVSFAIVPSAPCILTVAIDAFIPSDKIKAPAGTSFVKLTITVTGCILKSGISNGTVTQTIKIPYNDILMPAQNIDFLLPQPTGSITVTAARLQYYKDGSSPFHMINDAAWMPAGIINATYT